MTVKKGNKYCGEHLEPGENESPENEKRIPCPYDPSHTCYESKLEKHVKICNAKRILDAKPEYIVDGVNKDHLDSSILQVLQHTPLSDLDERLLENIISKVEIAYEKLPKVEELILQHEILNDEMNNASYGNNVKKHLIQNSSLISHIEGANLIQDDTCFIEFGAGKGNLMYWLAQLAKEKKGSKLFLVDRVAQRNKKDNNLRYKLGLDDVHRIRADIADLCLSKVKEIQGSRYIVGFAKHLCGAATDLTIKCLAKMKEDQGDEKCLVNGLVVAFCCHHRCDYTSYVGKKYLEECGFKPEEFSILCSIATWATCGSRRSHSHSNETTVTAMDIDKQAKREIIGQKVKALLNFGRVEYLKCLGFKTTLYFYTKPHVSLENMCMVVMRD